MALRDEQRIRIRDAVLSRVLDGEAVLLDLASGTYFGLNEVGTEIWEILHEGASVAEIRARIEELFEVDSETVARDLEALVTDLVARGLADLDG